MRIGVCVGYEPHISNMQLDVYVHRGEGWLTSCTHNTHTQHAQHHNIILLFSRVGVVPRASATAQRHLTNICSALPVHMHLQWEHAVGMPGSTTVKQTYAKGLFYREFTNSLVCFSNRCLDTTRNSRTTMCEKGGT